MLLADTEGYWNSVVTSIQDICNSNESSSLDNLYGKYQNDKLNKLSEDEMIKLKEDVVDHKSNIETVKRLVGTSQQNLQTLISYLEKKHTSTSKGISKGISRGTSKGTGSSKSTSSHIKTTASDIESDSDLENTKIIPKGAGKGKNLGSASSNTRSSSSSKSSGKLHGKPKIVKKSGRLYYTSKYNLLEPIYVGSEVAYKLKNRHFEEWIQCEVMKVIGDGIKFEIRDPEPDENNNPGQTFKASYKEILLIPRIEEIQDLTSYPYGTKVLARYPETTTFYPAIVVGERKDGSVRLKFDGEEEVNKETEVERRLVLPFPEK